jgi:hypothetical protein
MNYLLFKVNSNETCVLIKEQTIQRQTHILVYIAFYNSCLVLTIMTHFHSEGQESQADRSDCARRDHLDKTNSDLPRSVSVATVHNSLSTFGNEVVQEGKNRMNKRKKKKDPMAPRRPLSA